MREDSNPGGGVIDDGVGGVISGGGDCGFPTAEEEEELTGRGGAVGAVGIEGVTKSG